MHTGARAAEIAAVTARYRRFAQEEAPGRSAVYAAWAWVVASDPEVAAVLARLPAAHRQPPLVFAVMRMCGARIDTAASAWREWVLAHADRIVAECARRRVQTNEPMRCAALMAALMRIEGPIALLEAGAGAGLCLYPDRYSYRYRDVAGEVIAALDPIDGPSRVRLDARWEGGDAPVRLPEVVWRAGVDLQPLDARAADDRAWATGLVWPGESGRAARISHALDIAAADPALLHAADAYDGLGTLAALAPKEATLVVTTPGVMPYLSRSERERLADRARDVGRWITMDSPGLHTAVSGCWRSEPGEGWPRGVFALALDGEVIAAVDPLGARVRRVGEGWGWEPDVAAGR